MTPASQPRKHACQLSMPAARQLSQQSTAIRVTAVDDHQVVLIGLSDLLGQISGVQVMPMHRTSRDLLCALAKDIHEVAIVDLTLDPGDMPGLPLISAIMTTSPQTRVIVLSARQDALTVARCLRNGASAVISKSISVEELKVTIEETLHALFS